MHRTNTVAPRLGVKELACTGLHTAHDIPGTELPLFHIMEKRAGERRRIWVKAGAMFHQIG
jgi:hypothetical protein